ncbi:MAG: DUF1573 domain-containing protein [Bacteroidetes bacterium]|nr:DUF1573 domain-containing protein [Bacteroidota bacterium]
MKSTLNLLIVSACLAACSNNSSTVTDSNESNSKANMNQEISQDLIENKASADNPEPKPAASQMARMTFKTLDHDFGDIIENQNVETTFEFTNTGNADLLISNCQAACGCTVPDWPREPITPGKGGKIKVAFNSAGRQGMNNKIVTVFANIPENQIELKFKVNVKGLSK